jgi:hypothetical protein
LDILEAPPSKRNPFRTRVLDAGKPLFSSPEELERLRREIQEEEDIGKMRRSGF